MATATLTQPEDSMRVFYAGAYDQVLCGHHARTTEGAWRRMSRAALISWLRAWGPTSAPGACDLCSGRTR